MSKHLKTWLAVGQHLLRAALVMSSLPAMAAGTLGVPVDLNTADAATLDKALIGVGPAKAQAIVDHRRRHGPFKTIDELALVKGIGPRTLERNRERVTLGRGTGTVQSASAKATVPKVQSKPRASGRAPEP